MKVAVDDDEYGFISVSGIVGLDEDTDELYQDLVDAADNELFVHSSILHRAQRAEGSTITGHSYTATWDADEQELTGTIDLTVAATTPHPPALLSSPALADFIA